MTNIEISVLIANDNQKVDTQFDEGHHQLPNFDDNIKMLKELVKACNRKITALEEMLKNLDENSNKGNQRNKKNDDDKSQNTGNRTANPPIMYCHSCGCTNYLLNLIMSCPNPKTGNNWHAL